MSGAVAPDPTFPGGMAAAPELEPGRSCANPACSCLNVPGQTYCCLACARASDAADTCRCGHFGCAARVF